MTNIIQKFSNNQFGELRSLMIDDKPYFVAQDLCRELGYSNPRDAITRHVDEDDVTKAGIPNFVYAHGVKTDKTYKIKMLMVNESGLYALIFGSKLPQAKAFKRWVTSQVLPTIRKQGAYSIPEPKTQTITDHEAMIELALGLRREREHNEILQEQASIQSAVIKEVNPKAEYFDQLMKSESLYVTDQIAKELGMTAVRLNKELASRKIQFKRNGQWVLYHGYSSKGYTKPKTYVYTKKDGTLESVTRTVWTEIGRAFIRSLFALS